MTSVVGVDLAWGRRAASGVVVVQPTADGGRVTGSATVRDDDEIVALVPDRPVVVAFDAPIRVTNDTGRRACDAAVSRCFARFHAGAYPANRSIPWLAEPRAGVLAERMGLDLEPARAGADGARVALEVYPHAASVVLFGLERILAYKPRRGRDLGRRRAALGALVGHLASLDRTDPPLDVTSGPRWSQLVAGVEEAATPAALGRVEDELDAHVCAYVGLLATRRDPRLAVVGHPGDGAIVTPVTADLRRCLASAVPGPA
jgi:predicted RNase H-like nuclease